MNLSHDVNLAVLRKDVDQIKIEMAANTAATKEMVEAWRAAGKIVPFIKWLSGLATTFAAIWVVIEHFFTKR